MDVIIKYFIDEKKTTMGVARILAKTIEKYPDIRNEFIYWLENRSFDVPNAVEINGYSAKQISEIAPFLDAAGVYNFMVTLRDSPEKAKDYIRNRFPRK